jgi:phosphatidylserine decarboxylase
VEGEVVLSPADGRVMFSGPANADAAPPGTWLQVSIFLSPMDVHVNRIPASGRVTRVTYTPGRFLPAYRPDAATANERSEIWIDHHGQTIVARQVVGILARRVVCRVQVGAEVRAGDRFGIMKFGSRMDVFLPPTARIMVEVGQMVRGGETVIAVLH